MLDESTKIQGVIFDIKNFAIHDGPGIRMTVFFKGCPLHCYWCHNPEGISSSYDISYHKFKCMGCGKCIQICPERAIVKTERISIRREKCTTCGECTEICPTGALQMMGRKVTVNEVMEEIRKSIIYYDISHGGVTFSGGEPLMQPKFLKAILKRCKEEGIHTALDTSGYASSTIFKSIINEVDLFLYDLKLLDDEQHLKYTGVSNDRIIKNLNTLSEKEGERDVIIRFPVIPKITGTEKNIDDLVDLVSSLNWIREIDLLPFHNVEEKYKRLGKKYKMKRIQSPSENEMKSIKEKLENKGLNVKVGG